MNEALIKARLEELGQMQNATNQRLTQATQQVQGAQADLNAIAGAIQDCNYWLTKIAAPVIPADNTNEESGAPAAAENAASTETGEAKTDETTIH